MFNGSTTTVSAALTQIIGAAGVASSDVEHMLRGVASYNAAAAFWETRTNWDFLYVEAAPLRVFAPFGFSVVSASANEASALVATGHGLVVDDILSGTPFQAGTRVSATGAGSIGLNFAISSAIGSGIQAFSATATRDLYAVPAGFRKSYSMRLLGQQRVLNPVDQRLKGRFNGDENLTTSPVGYDISPLAASGKIRLVGAPAVEDILLRRYYRSITRASATGDATTMDVPSAHEPYFIAYGKWHYLADKSQERSGQSQTWLQLATDGVKILMADQVNLPDHPPQMRPDHTVPQQSEW